MYKHVKITRQWKSTLTLGNGIITNYNYLRKCGKKRPEKIQACTGFKLLTYAIPVQHSNQSSKKAIWELFIIKMGHSLGSNLSQK